MKIGYSVEGSTDRAFVKGLVERWCPGADLVEGSFRGSTGVSRRREIPKICRELTVAEKAATLIVFLTDSNDDDADSWREVLKAEEGRVPDEFKHLAIVGVCQRNIECWLCADADWLAGMLGRKPDDYRVADPKGPFEEALGITRFDRKEAEIAGLVREAPLRNWLRNLSFENFYEQSWQKSKQLDCPMENLRERET